MKLAIIDYGMGNLASVKNAISFLGFESTLVSSANELGKFDKYILPGVGAFGRAMENLSATGLQASLNKEVMQNKKPLLGLCLGMQLLFEESNEHGTHEGFGWLKGHVKNLGDLVTELPVPHMGWNDVKPANGSVLLKGISDEQRVFYFVHSYACFADDRACVKGTTEHGVSFDVVVEKENIFGCQFHPEKSQQSGLHILKNFVGL
jgi:imidazole glycerol-phosphate synthase subunit HisH